MLRQRTYAMVLGYKNLDDHKELCHDSALLTASNRIETLAVGKAVEFVARFYYLDYKPLIGTQMCYSVHDWDDLTVAMLDFSTKPRKLVPMDRFVG